MKRLSNGIHTSSASPVEGSLLCYLGSSRSHPIRYSTSAVAREPMRLPSGSGSIDPFDALFNKRCDGQTIVIAINKYCDAQTVGITVDKYCAAQTVVIAIGKYWSAQTVAIVIYKYCGE